MIAVIITHMMGMADEKGADSLNDFAKYAITKT